MKDPIIHQPSKRSKKGQFVKGNIPFYKDNLMSEETKEKIRLAKLGTKASLETRKKLSDMRKGKRVSPKTEFKRGENHPNYKGGVTSLAESIRKCLRYVEWRLQVFGRDNYTCRSCGLRGVYLEAHHKDLFSDILRRNKIKSLEEALGCAELWNIENGMTLCKKCHDLRPKIILWFYNNIHQGAKIGEGTKIGSFSDIGDNVIIGTNCKIQCHVSIPPLTRIGNDVFLGPGVRIINDKHMDGNLKGITIGKGAKIGAGAIIGNNIGKYAIVGMGSVVVDEVVEGTTVIGNPAKAIIK